MAKELYSDDIPIVQKPAIRIKGLGKGEAEKRDDGMETVDPKEHLERETDRLDAELSHHVLDEGEISRPGIPGWRPTPEYLEDLKFMEEPVLIRLEPSAERNAATAHYFAVNGKGAELRVDRGYQFITDLDDFDAAGARWYPVTSGYLPVGREMIVKRAVLEVILRSCVMSVETKVIENPGQDPDNQVHKFLSPTVAVSVLDDRNPKGGRWASNCRRRNY